MPNRVAPCLTKSMVPSPIASFTGEDPPRAAVGNIGLNYLKHGQK